MKDNVSIDQGCLKFAVGLFKRLGLLCVRVTFGIHMMRGE